jgi:hypothetical protein
MPAYTATVTARPLPPVPAVPPGGAPAGPGPRHPPRWPIALGVILLLAAAGAAAGLFLLRHPHSDLVANSQHKTSVGSSAGGSPASPNSGSASASPNSAPPAPPTELNIHGVPVGISAVNTDPDATGAATTLGTYFAGINHQNYQQAWDLYTPAEQAGIPFQSWANSESTSQISQVVIQSLTHGPNEHVRAVVQFQSHQAAQDGPGGETCTNWSLAYHLVPSGSSSPPYLISKVTDVGPGNSPC